MNKPASMQHLVLPEINTKTPATTQEYAYQRLHHALMLGSIAPGVSITIRGLAKTMDISPTPVREALRRLSSKNALTVLENRRIIVPTMSRARFHELIAARCAIETFAGERALPFMSDVLIDKVEKIDFEMDQAIDEDDREKLIVLNQHFHNTICLANDNQVVLPMIESIWLQLGPFMQIALSHLGRFYTVDRHKEIIASLRKHDLAGLKKAIKADIYDGVGRLGDDALEKILGSHT